MPQSPILREPLRIGLLVDSFQQPLWVERIIDEIASSSIAKIVLVIRNKRGEPDGEHVFQRLWQRRNHLFYAAYTRLDERLSKVEPDAFRKVSVEERLRDVPVVDVAPIVYKFTDRIIDADINRIRAYDLDVALRFGFRILKGEILNTARFGVWSYHHDDGRVYRGGPPGFWEVMTNDPVTGSMLQILNEELDNGQVIYRSWSSTINKFSVKKNNNNYYWKTSAFVMRKLRELYDFNEVTKSEPNSPSPPYSHRLYKTPTNAEMFRLALGLAGRAASRVAEKALTEEVWSLGYRFRLSGNDENNTFYKFKYLIPPSGKFWADPFPVKVGSKYYVFFEEFLYDKNKAHISVIELEKGKVPTKPVQVLERPYHLSYPFIFEWQGSYYMIPETGANNTVELYRAKSFPYEWEFHSVLLEARNPTDATLAEINGRWWMFVNIEEPGVTLNWEELHLYHADNPLGPWIPHRRNPIKSDVRNSRPAGRLFNVGESLFRPAQDCSTRYGYATAVNEVRVITPDEYVEHEVSRITPEWDRKVIGTHTLNVEGDLTVIDCLVKRNRVYAGKGLPMAHAERARPQVIHRSKENVLQFIHSFIQGGSERQMIQLTRLLIESGRYKVHVACLHDGGALRHEIERLGFKQVREFPLNSFYDRNMATQLRLFSAFLKENDIRLVHTHDFYSNIFGMAGAALGGVPVRIASRRETSGMRTPAQKKAERLAFRLANNIVTNAEAVRDQLGSEGVSRKKISVVYNGLDLERLKPNGLTRADLFARMNLSNSIVEGQPKFVTIVANMQHEVKDHRMFLRAARRIHEAIPGVNFLLAGEGRLLESIRAFAEEQGIGDNTFFLGRCEYVPDLLTVSDVCVLSSKAEGFSNAILEYMAAGRPVVATDVGGAREALVEGETGHLVASGDDATMADRVINLLREPERMRAMGAKARRTVEENFSCESQLRITEELYEKYLKQNRTTF